MSTIDERWNIVDTTRAFCQKVLPLVYDESLSYMELVCKLSSKMNEVIENNNNLPLYVKELIKETVNSDDFRQIVGSVLMDTIINVKFPPEGITPAKGDGVTDDTSSIQSCLDYANSQGGAVVFFPSGKYLTRTLRINTETSILGADRYNTSLVLKGGENMPLLQGVINQSVRNISLDGNRFNQVKENYLIDGTIDMALFDNVILCDSAHCITADTCNNTEFCNVMCKDIGDGVFITAAGNNNLLTNINTEYAINLTGNNNNWQSAQQTKISNTEPLVYRTPERLNFNLNTVEMQDENDIYNLLVKNNYIPEMRFVNVMDFGAKGDGLTNDSIAIQNAIDYALENNIYAVFVPIGNYLLDAPLSLFDGINLHGAARGDHNYTMRNATWFIANNGLFADKDVRNVKIGDFSVISSAFLSDSPSQANSIGIKINSFSNSFIDNISIYGFKTGIQIGDNEGAKGLNLTISNVHIGECSVCFNVVKYGDLTVNDGRFGINGVSKTEHDKLVNLLGITDSIVFNHVIFANNAGCNYNVYCNKPKELFFVVFDHCDFETANINSVYLNGNQTEYLFNNSWCGSPSSFKLANCARVTIREFIFAVNSSAHIEVIDSTLVNIEKCTFEYPNITNNIVVTNSQNITISNCSFTGASRPIKIVNSSVKCVNNAIKGIDNISLEQECNLIMTGNYCICTGINILPGSPDKTMSGTLIIGNNFFTGGSRALYMKGAINVTFIGNVCEGQANKNIYVPDAGENKIENSLYV